MNTRSAEKRLRVAAVILEYEPITGGAQNQLRSQAARMAANGVELVVITRRYQGMASVETIDGVTVYRLAAPPPKALASLTFSALAVRKIGQLKPDIVHAFSLFSPSTIAATASARYDIPAIAKVLRSGELGDVTRLLKKPGGRRRLTAYANRFRSFLCISSEIVGELTAAGVPARKCRVAPNGVRTDVYAPASPDDRRILRSRLELDDAAPIVVYTGRLVPEKRVIDVLDSWSQVRERCPGATLVVVGDGPSRHELQKGQQEGVRFTGNVANVSDYLRAADAFVLPSDCEGLSNALLEAMASGLACVVTNVGGAPDVISHRENGWLFPSRDRNSLVEGLTTVLTDDELRCKLGAAARVRIERDFDIGVTTDLLCEYYREISSR